MKKFFMVFVMSVLFIFAGCSNTPKDKSLGYIGDTFYLVSPKDTGITMSFLDTKGMITGSTGLNTYLGSFKFIDGKLDMFIGVAVGVTGTPEKNKIEKDFMAFINKCKKLEYDGEFLYLTASNGEVYKFQN